MDVNIPTSCAAYHEAGEQIDEDKAARTKVMNELAVYLWENYIE